jgi:hypothetical protein
MHITRRAFLVKITGLATLATGYSLAGQLLMKGNTTTSPISDGLSRLLQHPESARLIGDEYLRQNPEEGSIRMLTQKISGTDTQYLARGDLQVPRAEATSIGRQIRDDFEHGRITQIDGWYLAETEARMCALFSLQLTA